MPYLSHFVIAYFLRTQMPFCFVSSLLLCFVQFFITNIMMVLFRSLVLWNTAPPSLCKYVHLKVSIALGNSSNFYLRSLWKGISAINAIVAMSGKKTFETKCHWILENCSYLGTSKTFLEKSNEKLGTFFTFLLSSFIPIDSFFHRRYGWLHHTM